MRIGPKYKIARRLGAPIFEKTQTPKYSLSLARKEKSAGKDKSRNRSEFGRELIEKQKARFTYGLMERQFSNYATKALLASNPAQKLFTILESRLDNVLFRSGFTKTRAQGRQASSHGHVLLNGKRVTVPSILLSKGDTISLRAGSSSSPLFGEVSERMKTVTVPAWLKVDPDKREAVVEGEPMYVPQEHVFDLGVVVEFYNR